MLRAVAVAHAAARVALAVACAAAAAGVARAEVPEPREFAFAFEPLTLIPTSPHGVRQWRVTATGERRLGVDSSAVLGLGFGSASRDDLSLLVFEVDGQLRHAVLGRFERNVHVAAELGYRGGSGTRTVSEVAGLVDRQFTPYAVVASLLLGVKYTLDGGMAEYLQVGWTGVVGQTDPPVFGAGPVAVRAGIGWSF